MKVPDFPDLYRPHMEPEPFQAGLRARVSEAYRLKRAEMSTDGFHCRPESVGDPGSR